jgi:hypothetical protein
MRLGADGWAEAIATGVLTVQELKNGPAAMRALGLAVASAAPGGQAAPQRPTPATPRAKSCYPRQQSLETLMAQAIAIRRRG